MTEQRSQRSMPALPSITAFHEMLVPMLESCIAALQAEYHDQSVTLTPIKKQLGDMAALIVESMSRPGRFYHDMDHVFDVIVDMDPVRDAIPILAALFHDVVYLTIDKELSDKQRTLLCDNLILIDPETNKISLLPMESLLERADQLIKSIFSNEGPNGISLPRPMRVVDETNEYLSAMIAVRSLAPFLSWNHLFQIAVCIEATIPFRIMEDGSSAMDSLFQRLAATSTKDADMVSLTKEELVKTVQMAAFLANHDLGAFRAPDPLVFVNSSWKLLPEWCPSLASNDPKLQDLLDALLLMQQRYQQMQVSHIFQTFQDQPSAAMIEEWQAQATHNLEVVARFTTVRILALTILRDCLASHSRSSADTTLSLIQRVEVQFDNSLMASSHTRDDDVVSRQVWYCFMATRPFVSMWDAIQCRFSAALFSSLSWETIRERTQYRQAANQVAAAPVSWLPSAIQHELARVLNDNLF